MKKTIRPVMADTQVEDKLEEISSLLKSLMYDISKCSNTIIFSNEQLDEMMYDAEQLGYEFNAEVVDLVAKLEKLQNDHLYATSNLRTIYRKLLKALQ